jgi:hypothetical protein
MNKSDKILFLGGFRMKIELLNSLGDKLNTLVSGMENCKPVDYSGMPRGGISSDVSDKLAKKEELETRISSLIDKISDLRGTIINQIDDNIFEPRVNDTMVLYYIEGYEKEEIAATLGRSVRQIDRYLQDGLELILND